MMDQPMKSGGVPQVSSSSTNDVLQNYNDELEWSIDHMDDDVGQIDLNEFLKSTDFLQQAMDALTEEETTTDLGGAPVGKPTIEAERGSTDTTKEKGQRENFSTEKRKKRHAHTPQDTQGEKNEPTKKKSKVSGSIGGPSHRSHRKKPPGMPKRPLSAYNMFFRSERPKVFQEGKLIDHRIGFAELGRTIGRRWKAMDGASREEFNRLAEQDVERYRREMDAYNESCRQKRSKPSVTETKSYPSLSSSKPSATESKSHPFLPSERVKSPTSLVASSASPREVTPAPKSPRATVQAAPSPQDFSSVDNDSSSPSIQQPSSPQLSLETAKARDVGRQANAGPPRIVMRLPPHQYPTASPSLPPPPPLQVGYTTPSTIQGASSCNAPPYFCTEPRYAGKQSQPMERAGEPFFSSGPDHRLVRRYSEPPPPPPPPPPPRFEPYEAMASRPSYPTSRAALPLPDPNASGASAPFASGKEVILPDPKTGINRSYKIVYKCYRMTRTEANDFMKKFCLPASSESAPNQISLEQILRAPTPPGEEVSFPLPEDKMW